MLHSSCGRPTSRWSLIVAAARSDTYTHSCESRFTFSHLASHFLVSTSLISSPSFRSNILCSTGIREAYYTAHNTSVLYAERGPKPMLSPHPSVHNTRLSTINSAPISPRRDAREKYIRSHRSRACRRAARRCIYRECRSTLLLRNPSSCRGRTRHTRRSSCTSRCAGR